MSRRAKRAAFYAAQRYARKVRRIHRQHGHKPGYLGAVTSLTITLPGGRKTVLGAGYLTVGSPQ